VKAARALHNHVPTALLPTMAIFRCFGGGAILLLDLGGGREEAERLARFEVWSSQSTVEKQLPKLRLVLRSCQLPVGASLQPGMTPSSCR
jgi:hypothetical protein